jgi:hypothetical protein
VGWRALKGTYVNAIEKLGALPRVTRVLMIAVVVGATSLVFFKLMFLSVEVKDVLTVIALFSLVFAVVLDSAWMRWEKRTRR